jgi:hypothetical protein
MPRRYSRTMPREARNPSMSPEAFKTFQTRFMRAWVSTHYRKEKEAAHAENDAREAAEREQLARIGAFRDWDKKRARLKPVSRKMKKSAKKATRSRKKH